MMAKKVERITCPGGDHELDQLEIRSEVIQCARARKSLNPEQNDGMEAFISEYNKAYTWETQKIWCRTCGADVTGVVYG